MRVEIVNTGTLVKKGGLEVEGARIGPKLILSEKGAAGLVATYMHELGHQSPNPGWYQNLNIGQAVEHLIPVPLFDIYRHIQTLRRNKPINLDHPLFHLCRRIVGYVHNVSPSQLTTNIQKSSSKELELIVRDQEITSGEVNSNGEIEFTYSRFGRNSEFEAILTKILGIIILERSLLIENMIFEYSLNVTLPVIESPCHLRATRIVSHLIKKTGTKNFELIDKRDIKS